MKNEIISDSNRRNQCASNELGLAIFTSLLTKICAIEGVFQCERGSQVQDLGVNLPLFHEKRGKRKPAITIAI